RNFGGCDDHVHGGFRGRRPDHTTGVAADATGVGGGGSVRDPAGTDSWRLLPVRGTRAVRRVVAGFHRPVRRAGRSVTLCAVGAGGCSVVGCGNRGGEVALRRVAFLGRDRVAVCDRPTGGGAGGVAAWGQLRGYCAGHGWDSTVGVHSGVDRPDDLL